MKEKIAPMVLSAGIALGGYGLLDNEAHASNESCVDDEARAMALAAYRTAVDADLSSTVIFLALSGQEGRPYTYEEYRELYDYMVDDILEGEDPLAPGFRQDAGDIYVDEGVREDGE